MSVKDRIKELCEKNKISVNRLEKELGFATGYISKLDKSTPNTKKIKMIADYFNVSLDYLLTGKESEFLDDIVMEEIELIDMYRKLSKEQKENIINIMQLFTKKTNINISNNR